MSFVSKADAQREAADQKGQLGRWIFSSLTTFSKEEFIFMVKHAEKDHSLSAFKRRIAKARELYQKIGEQCTSKQAAYIDKPFFYKISYAVGHKQTVDLDGEEEKVPCAMLSYELDSFNTEQVDVTAKIPTVEHYRSFSNVISDVLQSNSAVSARQKDLQDALNEEKEEAAALLESHREMFNKFLAKNLLVGKHLPPPTNLHPTAVALPHPRIARRTSSVDEATEDELNILLTPTTRKENSKPAAKGGKDKTTIVVSTAADHQREAALAHVKDKIGNDYVPGGAKQASDRVEEQISRQTRRSK